jgi:hypothetical protein
MNAELIVSFSDVITNKSTQHMVPNESIAVQFGA